MQNWRAAGISVIVYLDDEWGIDSSAVCEVVRDRVKSDRGLTGGFLLLQNFCVAISVSPHVCFILVLILISMFLR